MRCHGEAAAIHPVTTISVPASEVPWFSGGWRWHREGCRPWRRVPSSSPARSPRLGTRRCCCTSGVCTWSGRTGRQPEEQRTDIARGQGTEPDGSLVTLQVPGGNECAALHDLAQTLLAAARQGLVPADCTWGQLTARSRLHSSAKPSGSLCATYARLAAALRVHEHWDGILVISRSGIVVVPLRSPPEVLCGPRLIPLGGL